VADLLARQGFEIIDRNWKSKVCEIDLVAEKGNIIFFTEVKYRSSTQQGDGFEYITDMKQRRKDFAARIWCQSYNWNGDYRLLAAAVSGAACDKIELIEVM